MPIIQVKTWKSILQQLIALSKARDTRQATSVTATILWLHTDCTLLKPFFVARIQQQERCLPTPYVPATNRTVSRFIRATTSLGVYILLIGHRNNPRPIHFNDHFGIQNLVHDHPTLNVPSVTESAFYRISKPPNHRFWIDLSFNGIPMLTVPASPCSTTTRRWIILSQHSHRLNCSISARPRSVSPNFCRRSDLRWPIWLTWIFSNRPKQLEQWSKSTSWLLL